MVFTSNFYLFFKSLLFYIGVWLINSVMLVSGVQQSDSYICSVIHIHVSILLQKALVAQMVKSLPAMQETWVRSLGQEEPLEKEMAIQYPVLLPGKFHGWRSLVGYSPWGHKELDTCQSDSVPGTGNKRDPFKELTV